MLFKIKIRGIKILLAAVMFTSMLRAQVQAGDSLKYLKRTSYLSDNPKHSQLDLFVDSIVYGFMQSPQNCGISIGISQNGKTSFYNYGESSRDSKQITKSTTIYEIGSLTAGFTGFLLAKAVTEKKLSLEDDIRKFLPGENKNLVYDKNPVRVKHLAHHSSGLPHLPGDLITQQNYDPANPYKNYSRDQLLNYLHNVQLATSPGTAYDYSSFGLSLLGIILENVYGASFELLVKEKISGPLAMPNTVVNPGRTQPQDLASGYTEDGVPTPHWILDGFVAAGSLKSDAADLIHFLEHQSDESNEAVKLAQEVIPLAGGKKTSLAWSISKTKHGNTLMYQSGGTFGSGGFTGFLKEKRCALAIICNSGRNVDYIAIALLNYMQQ